MTISRRHLYQAGEPIGDACTRREAGRTIYGGGGDSSSAQTTNQADKRVVVDSGLGVSGDANVINVTDGGIVSRALDSIDLNNATNAAGFEQLLTAADRLFDRGESLIGTTQKHVADAYAVASQEAKGTIDNRTIIVLAAVAGAAIIMRGWK